MIPLKRSISVLFLVFLVFALLQCAKRGNPSGGPKDLTAPSLIRAEPENLTTNFEAKRIRLYFDEYIKLQDIQNQLIVSPPLKYNPQIRPQGGASKFVEIIITDTLKENTTYTLNFGQSIVDNNEGNPNSFLSYVFSTGSYIDSLTVSGVVRDAFNKEADPFISVMLYAIDTAFTDSTIYKNPPYYITNTLDSTIIFHLKNLKAGKYAMIALRDEGKNNMFDQKSDKIAFLKDTVTLPTDSIFLLTLFREVPDYGVPPPNYAANNKIIFGYNGKDEQLTIEPLTPLPDTVRTLVAREQGKDTLNFWFTPFEADSIIFRVSNEKRVQTDTFTVKTRKLPSDSLLLNLSHRGNINFQDTFHIAANIPIVKIDTSKISMINRDSLPVALGIVLDTAKNRLTIDFDKEPNENYILDLLPESLTDFFENTIDTTTYRLSTGSYADYGNLRLTISGEIAYPVIVQLTNERGEVVRQIYATKPQLFEFNTLAPATYIVRLVFDANENGQWDTGNYLQKIQPEKVLYYPKELEVRSNWELEENFTITE